MCIWMHLDSVQHNRCKVNVFCLRLSASFLTLSKTNSHLFLVNNQYSRTSIQSMPILNVCTSYTHEIIMVDRLLLLFFFIFFWADICYFHLPHICVLMLCYVPLNILLWLYSIEVYYYKSFRSNQFSQQWSNILRRKKN